MVKYIEFGEYNKNYNFIFLAVISNILLFCFPKFLIDLFLKYKIISNRVEELYNNSIIPLISSFFMFIFSCILNKYESKLSERKSTFEKLNDSSSDKGCFKRIKINEEKKKELNNNKNFLNILTIIIIITFLQNIARILDAFIIFSYSMIILLIISFINTKMFNIKIYNHQKCDILFNFSVIFVFRLLSFILSLISKDDECIYIKYLWLIPIGLIFYFLVSIVLSYAYSKIKWFMDLNLISLSKLLINFALIGFLIKTIFCVLFTFIKCGEKILFVIRKMKVIIILKILGYFLKNY